ENVLLEGAQATMLDLDHGTYPFVTSSNPVAGYALASTGIGPRHVDRVIGIMKAYVTKVGSGPFPTRDDGPDGERLGELGEEFGTTTGRKRDCGWFDAVVVRYAARVNGLTEVFLTKLDILSGFPALKVCTSYDCEGEIWTAMPTNQTLFHHAKPVYEELKGWDEDISGITEFDELPQAAQDYLRRLEELVGVPIRIASVGPSREQSLSVP
ncbi:MAG: adenylosuccinate synthetase, partial [Actinobacteria bacterium]|nr:adenylosuccinate synthetase [Actinomycetota bacterium]